MPPWRFGRYTLDPAARLLTSDQREVHLSPKAFSLLVELVERRPAVLGHDELHALLWPDTHVADVNLAVLVAEVRRALEDDGKRQRYVRTVQRVGYSWAAATTDTAAPMPAGNAGSGGPCWRVVVWGSGELRFADGEYDIGRDPGSAIPIRSFAASRRHARLLLASDSARLQDLGSKNGTRVNGARIEGTVRLPASSEVRIGNQVISVFRLEGSAAPTVSAVEEDRGEGPD